VIYNSSEIRFLLVSCLCFGLAVSAGWGNTQKKEADGLRMLSAALYLQALVYIVFALHDALGNVISIVLGNALVAASFSAFLAALHVFQGRIRKLVLLVAPTVVVSILLLCTIASDRGRTIASHAVFFAQSMLIVWTLLRHKENFPVRGRTLVLVSISLNALVSLMRVVVAIFSLDRTGSFLSPLTLLLVSYLSVCFTCVLIANGFLLMAKERSDHQLMQMAMTDALTGCWNRGRFEDAVRGEMERLIRYGTPVSLLMIDLDYFKAVNDRYGHVVGDAVLQEFVRIVQGSIRVTDMLSRWGGEEFVVLQTSSGFIDSLKSAERIRCRLEEHKFAHGVQVTASIGVSMCRSTDLWNDWLERVDHALYRAKAAGRNQVWTEGVKVIAEYLPEQRVEIPRLFWTPDYECGYEEIDAQHKDLIDLVNRLHLSLLAPSGEENAVILIQDGMRVVQQHFASEEELMERVHPGRAEEHKKIHVALNRRAENLLDMYRNKKTGAMEILHFISYELVVQHILIEDQHFFREALRLRGVGEA